MKPAPASPSELVAALSGIFPTFAVQRDPDDEDDLTFHGVFLFAFNPFFGKHIGEFTSQQLRAFSQLLARCLAVPGSLANAVDTCFLEHTRQIKVNRQLNGFLKEALKS
jgi:hypothetical protein